MRVWSGTQASNGDSWAGEGGQEIKLHRPGHCILGPECFIASPQATGWPSQRVSKLSAQELDYWNFQARLLFTPILCPWSVSSHLSQCAVFFSLGNRVSRELESCLGIRI